MFDQVFIIKIYKKGEFFDTKLNIFHTNKNTLHIFEVYIILFLYLKDCFIKFIIYLN